MKKKKIIILSAVVVILVLGLVFAALYFSACKKSYGWNYEGSAVVLTQNYPYDFVEITDVALDGEVYGLGRYFLGDLHVGALEKEKHFYMEAGLTRGMMTPYRHYKNTEGEDYFEDKEVRERFQIKVETAHQIWSSDEIPGTKMLQFQWYEYFGGVRDLDYRVHGAPYFKEAGDDLFVIETPDYVIVPGVSTREEALAVLREHFLYLGSWSEFEFTETPDALLFEGISDTNPASGESALLARLCEKAKQLYTVEPVETEHGLTVLVHQQIPAKTPDETDAAGEVVAQYELPYQIAVHNARNFYYDGEIFAIAEGAFDYDSGDEGSKTLSILVSQNGGEFERMEVGETESGYDGVHFSFGENGRIALLTESSLRHHEVFLRPDGASEWRRIGTAESFDLCYDRLADQISFFDESTGVVGTPFVDPFYTNFIRTEDAGQTWSFAEKELLENTPAAASSEEYWYSVESLHCEGNCGAALVRVGGLNADGSFAYYLYTTVNQGKTWQIQEKISP